MPMMPPGAGFPGYLGLVEVPWRVLALFTGIARLGILVGTRLVRSFSRAGLVAPSPPSRS